MVKSLKILLVIPRSCNADGRYIMPMGILYVSAYTKSAGINIFTLNLNHFVEPLEDIITKFIRDNHIDVVATGGLSGEYLILKPIFDVVKKQYPNIVTVLGGGIVTAEPQIAMDALKNADIGIVGEGEITWVELVRAMENNKSLSEVKGLIYRTPKGYFQTAEREEIADLNALPFPDYEGFEYSQFLKKSPYGTGNAGELLTPASVLGSRSCPFRCTFCFHPTGKKYRVRSMDSIFEEIDYLYHHYSVNYITLQEELFSSSKQRIFEFCSRISSYKMNWSIQLRADVVDREIFQTLKRSNCLYLYLGIESADDFILRSMRKKITISQVEQSLAWADEFGLLVRSAIILGDQRESLQSALRSLQWWKKYSHYNPNFGRNIRIDMIIPFPGSELYRNAVLSGKIKNQVGFLQANCPLVNLTQMSDEEYRYLLRVVQGLNCQKYHLWKDDICELIDLRDEDDYPTIEDFQQFVLGRTRVMS